VKKSIADGVRTDSGFRPLVYAANVNATTTVTGQSVALHANALNLMVGNLDTTNFARIAFGTSAADAETNAANGVLVQFRSTNIIGVPDGATHYAYLGDTGTVVLGIVQGG
jgi:hypothetical protein